MHTKKIFLAAGLLFLCGSLHAAGGIKRAGRSVQGPPGPAGATGADGAAGPAGAFTYNGSTQVITLKWPGAVFQSTIALCGYPGACYDMGPDSGSIIDVWADAVSGSTVSAPASAFTQIRIAFSSGGLSGLPVSFRLPEINLSTATSTNKGAYSGVISSAVPVNAFEKFGIQVTTVPSAGNATTELRVHFGMWFATTRY